jgi:hypothetical protein
MQDILKSLVLKDKSTLAPISPDIEQKMSIGLLFILDISFSNLQGIIPKVSYLDRSTAFEKASKKFRRAKARKLKPVIEADLMIDGIRKNIKLPKTPQNNCAKHDRRNGHTVNVDINYVKIGNLSAQSKKAVRVLPPIIQNHTTNTKGFSVSKASTGRLLEQSTHAQKECNNSDLLNVFLVGTPIGFNPEDVLKLQKQNETTEFRNWTADLESSSSVNSQILSTLEMDPYFAADTVGDIYKVPTIIEENVSLEGQLNDTPAHDFKGMDDIDNLTLKIGLNFD